MKPSGAIVVRAVGVAVPALAVVFAVLPAHAASASARSTPAAAAAAAAKHGSERFRLISHKATAIRLQAQATGVLNARGYARVRPVVGGRATTWLVFTAGSVRLVTEAKASSASVPNPATCKFTEVVRGDYAIRGGARGYAGASGFGSYVTRIVGHLSKLTGGGCGTRLASFWQSTNTSGSLRW